MSQQRWSGEFHIVDNRNGESLESWGREEHARYFCDAVNEHEINNGRPAIYVVEHHSIAWRNRAQDLRVR